MSEDKKSVVTEEVKEEVRKLTEEELGQVTGGRRGGKPQVHLSLNTVTGED